MGNHKLSPVGRHHTVIKSSPNNVDGSSEPILCLAIRGQPLIVKSVSKYFKAHPSKSYNWMRNTVRAIGLFYDYTTQQSILAGYQSDNCLDVLRQFGVAISVGTISPKSANDPLDLFWPPSSIQTAKKIISALKNFVDWCVMEGVINNKDAFQNIDVRADEKVYLKHIYVATRIKLSHFFSHTMDTQKLALKLKKQEEQRVLDLGSSTVTTVSSVKHFPSWLIPDLLEHGFITQSINGVKEENITAKFITVLLLFGGLRLSEPFHLWFNDVIPQISGECKVILRHPSDSLTHILGEPNILRKQYLAMRGLVPRNTRGVSKSYHSGWKNLAVDESLSAHIFFLHSSAENLVRNMFYKYLNYRAQLMRVYAATHGGGDHPFLFVSSQGEFAGNPCSKSAYVDALDAAYNRLERKFGYEIPRGKNSGTSPHGPRHFYGQSLVDGGAEPKIIQKALRHRSALSQSVYTEASNEKVQEQLDRAKMQIESNENIHVTKKIVEILNGH